MTSEHPAAVSANSPEGPGSSAGPVSGKTGHPEIARRGLSSFGMLLVALGLLVLPVTGCSVMGQFRPGGRTAPLPAVQPAASADQLVAQLNERTARVRQLKSSVRVAAAGLPGLRGDLLVERPDRLRLQAGLMGMNEAGFDLGSNEEHFWIWQKMALPGQPETFYHARHLEYQQSALRQQLQLQPLWLIDALGLVQFSPSDRHEGPFPRPDGRVELRTWSDGRNGAAIRRMVIDPKTLEIHQQSFYDQNGQLVGWLDSIRHEAYPEFGLSLPRRIEIHVLAPGASAFEMTVDAGKYEINSIYGDPARLWQMPQPEGIQRVDLAGGGRSPAVVETAEQPSFRSMGQSGYR